MRLSILIPCYRAERYIRRCLDSVLGIDLSSRELEVICFDDFAPDGTPTILDEYAFRYRNMRVIHSLANVGPGAGRNTLLGHAHGKYIWFVDADDMVIPDVVPELLKRAEDNDLDVLVFDWQDIDEGETIIPKSSTMTDTGTATGCELGNSVFPGGLIRNLGYPVRFILMKDYVAGNGILFPAGMTYGEDTVWMAKVVLLAKRMQSSSVVAYRYWHHETSTCGQFGNVYPGKTIYERCIMTASQMLEFADSWQSECSDRDRHYADEIRQYAQSHYVNQLPILLGRTRWEEIDNFYNRLDEEDAGSISNVAHTITSLLMLPYLGKSLAYILNTLYKLSH